MSISCAICTFINFGRPDCEVCQATFARPCPACTFNNHPDLPRCELCDFALIVATPGPSQSVDLAASNPAPRADLEQKTIKIYFGEHSFAANAPSIPHIVCDSKHGPDRDLALPSTAAFIQCPCCSMGLEVDGVQEGRTLVCGAGSTPSLGCGWRFQVLSGVPVMCD